MNPILSSAFLFFGGAMASLLLNRRPAWCRLLPLVFAILGSGNLLAKSVLSLLGQGRYDLVISGPASIPGFHFYSTPLSALFVALISGLSLVVGIYALDYSKEYEENAASLGFFYNLFLLAMSVVPLAQNVFSFLFCWEGMALASFFLVILEHQKQGSRRAAVIYLVMSHIGTAFIFILFFLLHQKTGSLEFDAFRKLGPQISGDGKNLLFLLALAGFGVKAGIVPLHLWLPYAHPAAPSHVSSLMSGVMIKTALYGFLLTVFTFLGLGPWWWGGLVLVLAVFSSLIGILYAMMERNLKRLLAYSSFENIGIILMGIGAGMLHSSWGRNDLAALSLMAGLYHALNHAAFKGLLFLASGSVIQSTHTKDMEKLGGLTKTMPVTAAAFLIGSLAISAMPPLNGFASEWLIFQSLLSGFKLPSPAASFLCLLASAGLALTGGLAAACFVKAFGIIFLAQPRSEHARGSKEAPILELAALAVLSLGCFFLGLFPGAAFKVLKPAAEVLIPSANFTPWAQNFGSLSSGYGAISPMTLLVLLIFGSLAALLICRLAAGRRQVRIEPTWACGLKELTPRMEYTGAAFSKPFRMLFAFFYKPVREIRQETAGSPYFPRSIQYSNEITRLIKEKLYRPPLEMMLDTSHRMRRIQAGSLNLYLGYLLATVVALLTLFVWKEI